MLTFFFINVIVLQLDSVFCNYTWVLPLLLNIQLLESEIIELNKLRFSILRE